MFSSVSPEQQRKGGEVHARNISCQEERQSDEFSEKFQGGKGHSHNQKKLLKILLFIEAIFDINGQNHLIA